MKKYMVLYRAPITAAHQMSMATPDQAKAGMEAWMAWSGKAGSALVDMGSPLNEGAILKGEPNKGHIGGYSIVQAESLDAAKALMEAHPHLKQDGFSIEILEFLPIPGM
jgi:hypothetical protein